ncbi:hypothetical protein PanWU01x14_273510, partial [Parasponia andersonii]
QIRSSPLTQKTTLGVQKNPIPPRSWPFSHTGILDRGLLPRSWWQRKPKPQFAGAISSSPAIEIGIQSAMNVAIVKGKELTNKVNRNLVIMTNLAIITMKTLDGRSILYKPKSIVQLIISLVQMHSKLI